MDATPPEGAPQLPPAERLSAWKQRRTDQLIGTRTAMGAALKEIADPIAKRTSNEAAELALTAGRVSGEVLLVQEMEHIGMDPQDILRILASAQRRRKFAEGVDSLLPDDEE